MLWKRSSAKDFNRPILEPVVYIGMPRYILEYIGMHGLWTKDQPKLWEAEGLKEPDCRNHDITSHLADVGCCMTILYGMCQIYKDPGIYLWMVAWLKCCDVTWLLESSLKVLQHTTGSYTQPSLIRLESMCDIPWNTGSTGTLYTLISPLCLRALVRCDVVCCQGILV